MPEPLAELLRDIRGCTLCADHLPCGPRPVLQAGPSARLRVIGQAPGRKVHTTGVPWDDPSGDRLRTWLGLTPPQFYDPGKVAVMSMGFCYPGKARSGDQPPRSECVSHWHEGAERSFGRCSTHVIGRSVCTGTLSTWSAQADADRDRQSSEGLLAVGVPSPSASFSAQPAVACQEPVVRGGRVADRPDCSSLARPVKDLFVST